jgi:hypothetical protein
MSLCRASKRIAMLAMLAIGSAVALTAQAIPGPGNSQPLGKELQGISSQLQGNTAQANGNAAQLQGNAALLQGILGGKAGQPQSLPAMSVAPQRRLSSGPRITSQPVPPASTSADIGGVMQVPGIPGGSVPWSVVVMLTALTLIPSILVCMTASDCLSFPAPGAGSANHAFEPDADRTIADSYVFPDAAHGDEDL